MDHQVVATGLHGRRDELLGEQVGQLLELTGPVVAVVDEVLPAAADRRCDGAHRVEDAGLLVGAERLEHRLQADPLLGGRGAGQVGVELVLHDLLQGAGRVLHPGCVEQPLGPPGQQVDLVGERHRQRVDVVGRHPLDVPVRRLRGQLDRPRRHRRGDLRRADRGLGDLDGRRLAEADAGGEPPGAVEHDADGEADVLGVRGALEPPVAHPDVLRADPLEPEVGVADVEVLGPGQRRLRHPAVGQRGERRVDLVRRGHDPRLCRRGPGCPAGSRVSLPFRVRADGHPAVGGTLSCLTVDRSTHGLAGQRTPPRRGRPGLRPGRRPPARHAADPDAVEQALGRRRAPGRLRADPRHRRAARAARLDGCPAHAGRRPAGRHDAPTGTTDGAVVPVRDRGPSTPGWRTASDRSTWPSSAGCRRSSAPGRRRRPWSTSTRAATGRPPWRSRWSPHGRRTRPCPGRSPRGWPARSWPRRPLDDETDLDAHQAAALIQELHAALGSDAQVEVTDDGVIEMSMTTCPFGPAVGDRPVAVPRHRRSGRPDRRAGARSRDGAARRDPRARGPGLPPARPPGARGGGRPRRDPPVADRGDHPQRADPAPRPVPEPARTRAAACRSYAGWRPRRCARSA